MLNPTVKTRLIVAILALFAAVTVFETAAAQKSTPRPQDRLALGEENVRQLLLLMETDKNGMVSKQDYMKFMEDEFQRLDKSNQNRLNARELNRSSVYAARYTGK